LFSLLCSFCRSRIEPEHRGGGHQVTKQSSMETDDNQSAKGSVPSTSTSNHTNTPGMFNLSYLRQHQIFLA